MASALEGIRVVDLSSHLSGPYCAMLLADHGADVIKVERPDGGDDARGMPPFVAGESAPFMIWNRNKRSVALDLKSEASKATLLKLVDKADVLISRPGHELPIASRPVCAGSWASSSHALCAHEAIQGKLVSRPTDLFGAPRAAA